jgi:hypothetical protein
METTGKEPPLVLIETWYQMLIQNECKEAQARAQEMFSNSFVDEQAVLDCLKKHKIL